MGFHFLPLFGGKALFFIRKIDVFLAKKAGDA
jgi:hypothetical protein